METLSEAEKPSRMGMGKKIIYTQKAPAPAGPYSQAVEKNGFLFLSGQISANTAGDIKSQAMEVLQNIKTILEAAGCKMEDVVKTTIFLTDLSRFSDVNEVYKEFFPKDYPARSTIGVSSLPKGAGIQMEVIAIP